MIRRPALRPVVFLPLLALLTLGAAWFHNHLVKSSPGNGETLAAAPTEIRLWFSERPEPAFTSATLLRGDSTRVAALKAMATPDSLAVALPLANPLEPGTYIVAGRTASRDGHAIRGRFTFTVTR